MSASMSYELYKESRSALSVQNSSGARISVLLGGTSIPLENHLYLGGFTPNQGSTAFVVEHAGMYLVSYAIETTAGLLMSSGVYKNGNRLSELARSPGLAASSFSCSGIIPLAAGDSLSLVLYGLLSTAVLTGGVGAYLNAVRII